MLSPVNTFFRYFFSIFPSFSMTAQFIGTMINAATKILYFASKPKPNSTKNCLFRRSKMSQQALLQFRIAFKKLIWDNVIHD